MRRTRHLGFWASILVLLFVFPPGAAIMAAGYVAQWGYQQLRGR